MNQGSEAERLRRYVLFSRPRSRAASHNALLTRWAAYQLATEVLTHEVGARVSPERARGFERVAAGALLLRGHQENPESPRRMIALSENSRAEVQQARDLPEGRASILP